MVKIRQIWGILGLIWSATLWGADDPAKDRIRINEPDWPPFFYAGRPVGQKAGIAKDIVDICFKQMGRTYEWVPLPIERMQNEMQLGQLDINFFSYKKERESFLTFGKELAFVTGYRPVVKKNSPIVINAIKDFDSYKLGHTIGLRYSNEFLEYIQKRKKRDDVDETPHIESNLKKLLAGRIDIFVADSSSILALAVDQGVADQIKILDFPIQDGRYFISLSKKSPRLGSQAAFADAFDRCLADLKKQGTYCGIFQNYQQPCPLHAP